MRKITVAMMVMAIVISLAGISLADDVNVNVRNDIINNNSAAAAADSKSSATGGNAVLNNSYITPVQPYNPNAPMPIQSGPELSIGEWGLLFVSNGLSATIFDGVDVTMEQALSLSDEYYGFFVGDRIGNEAIMMRNLPVSASIRIAKYWGRMPGDEYVASFPIFGEHGDQLEGLIGLAMKRSMELGATKVGIMIRVVKEVNTKGLSLGTGAGAGLYIPCNSGVGTGMNFGAYISNTKTDDKYELNVIALRGGAYVPPKRELPPPAPPEVKKPEKPCPPCDEKEILRRLREVEERLESCDRYGHVNMVDRLEAGKISLEYALCLKKNGKAYESYLERSIQHLQMAELNYIHGYDISQYQDSSTILGRTEYWLATAFFQRYHDESFREYKKPPLVVRHENKRTHEYKWVRTTKSEQERIKEFRRTQEKYSREPVIK